MFLKYLAVLTLLALTFAQDDDYYDEPRSRPAPARIQQGYSGPAAQKAPPVAILKQINRHNEDGSYTYGYESADGTFKIETKLPTGEVKGKYGYVDDTGKVREVEYGATKNGFAPVGEGITIPPPTLVDDRPESERQENMYYEPAPAPLRNAPAPRARAQSPLQDFDNFSPPQQFEPAQSPPARASAPVQHNFDFDSFGPQSSPARSFAPVARPRPAPVQYAQPAPIEEEYEPAPAPRQQPRITYAQPAPLPARAAPSFAPDPRPPQQFSPAPRPAPSFAPAPRPRPSSPSGSARGGGILDQLSRDYALPEGGSAPLHDISFGYY